MTGRIYKTPCFTLLLALLCACSDGAPQADSQQLDLAVSDLGVDLGGPDLDRDAGGDGGDLGVACAPAFSGDPGWTRGLEVAANVRYCAVSGGGSATELPRLLDEMQDRVELSIVPGSYRLPHAAGVYSMTLPVCLRKANGSTSTSTPGSVTATAPSGAPANVYELTQDFTVGGDAYQTTIRLREYASGSGGGGAFQIDDRIRRGTHPGPEQTSYVSVNHAGTYHTMFPCNPGQATENTTTVTHDRGTITFWGYIPEGTLCAGGSCLIIVNRAQGTLDATPITQTNPFQLGHMFYHHNVGGFFELRLDQPIGQICGLRFDLKRPEDGPTSGWTIDCNGTPIDALNNLSYTQTGSFGP